YVHSPQARADARAWLAAPWSQVYPLPQDGAGPGLLPSIRTARTPLSTDDTQLLLFGLPRAAARPGTLLTSAILVAVGEWSGRDSLAIDVYSHSRDTAVGGLDVSRTVGYVQATYPVVRRLPEAGPAGVLALAGTDPAPPRRYGFDALRFNSPDTAERHALRGLPPGPLRLNYRSQLDRLERRAGDSLLADAAEDTGAHRSPRQRERYQLMFEGDVMDGRLVVGVKYSTDHYHPETAQALTDRVAELVALAARRLAS
ncbi:MAG: amino acid adenylation protein, partial [Dactylosporangium sp.]|nr:amino acid adenylation protein [Dactylosporangium sp.]